LASISAEVSRLISEFDSKIGFIRYIFTNSDHSTYISMTNIFIEYMRNDALYNVDLLLSMDLEKIREPIVPEIQKIDNSPDRKIKKEVQFAKN